MEGERPSGGALFAQPTGLFVLFFAEMWERFSFYGMRALLIFYLTRHWLFAEDKAYAIYGSYLALAFISPLVGGHIADRFLGQRKAIQFGAVLLTIGHGLMVFEGPGGQHPFFVGLFWLALAFIIMGVGFLKANITALVGALYEPRDPRREPAFTIFYIGINLGAALGALTVGYLGQTYGWRYGFGAAGVGMLGGLLVFVLGRPTLLGRGEPPDPPRLASRRFGISTELRIYAAGCGGVLLVWLLLQYQQLVGGLLVASSAVVVGHLLYQAFAKLDRIGRDRLLAALFLIALQPLFWALFEQAGSSLNLYTDEEVDRVMLGWTVPAAMLQSINAIFVIILGPIFSALWLWMARRDIEPSTPAKFGFALIQLGAGFLVLVWGAQASAGPTPIIFIFAIYLLHTSGELCLSPVGLSAMTQLAPSRMVGLVMGTWFLAMAAGNFLSGLIAQAAGADGAEPGSAGQLLHVYAQVGWIAAALGAVVLAIAPWISRLMHR